MNFFYLELSLFWSSSIYIRFWCQHNMTFLVFRPLKLITSILTQPSSVCQSAGVCFLQFQCLLCLKGLLSLLSSVCLSRVCCVQFVCLEFVVSSFYMSRVCNVQCFSLLGCHVQCLAVQGLFIIVPSKYLKHDWNQCYVLYVCYVLQSKLRSFFLVPPQNTHQWTQEIDFLVYTREPLVHSKNFGSVMFVMCTLFSRVRMTFCILIKWYTLPGNQGTHDKHYQIQNFYGY